MKGGGKAVGGRRKAVETPWEVKAKAKAVSEVKANAVWELGERQRPCGRQWKGSGRVGGRGQAVKGGGRSEKGSRKAVSGAGERAVTEAVTDEDAVLRRDLRGDPVVEEILIAAEEIKRRCGRQEWPSL